MKSFTQFIFSRYRYSKPTVRFVPGPDNWHACYPEAAGIRQSPIDINPVNITSLITNQKLQWKYVPENVEYVTNPGYCWKVQVKGEGSGKFSTLHNRDAK